MPRFFFYTLLACGILQRANVNFISYVVVRLRLDSMAEPINTILRLHNLLTAQSGFLAVAKIRLKNKPGSTTPPFSTTKGGCFDDRRRLADGCTD